MSGLVFEIAVAVNEYGFAGVWKDKKTRNDTDQYQTRHHALLSLIANEMIFLQIIDPFSQALGAMQVQSRAPKSLNLI
jgi:hypothetical protein